MNMIIRFILPSFACLLLLFATGCASISMPKSDSMIASGVTVEGGVEGRPSVGLPISVENSRVVMLPFAVEHQKGWFEKDAYSVSAKRYYTFDSVDHGGGSGGGPAQQGLRWNNVIFKDLDSGKEWLLLDRRSVIVGYRVLGPSEKKDDEWEFTPVETLFEVTTQDTDGDGVLTRNDITQVIASGAEGENIRVITPPGVDVISYRWDTQVDEIFLRGRADTNKDGRFDGLDESEPYVLKPGASQAVPLVGGAIQQKADSILR